MLYIRQGATHKVVIGPAVSVSDGFTPVTSLSLASADEAEVILHDNGTVVDISGYTFAAITTADGYYHLTLQSGISNTVGHMTVVINDDSLCLPLRADFTVVEEAVFDALFAASANAWSGAAGSSIGTANVTQVGGNTSVPTNMITVFASDFSNNYNTTADCWLAQLDDSVTHGGESANLQLDDATVASVSVTTVTLTDLNVLGGQLVLEEGITANITGNLSGSVGSVAGATFVSMGLDHLVSASVTGTDIADNSIIARLASKSATADWDSYNNTTDSLEAIRDNMGTAQTADHAANITAILADTNELQTDWANGGRLDLIVDAILADTGTDGVALSAATCNKIADHGRRRTQANVESSSDGDSLSLGCLYGFIQQAQESNTDDNPGALTVYRTNGTTELGQKTLTTDAGAEPITGIE